MLFLGFLWSTIEYKENNYFLLDNAYFSTTNNMNLGKNDLCVIFIIQNVHLLSMVWYYSI